MVTHLVFWKLKDEFKDTAYEQMKEKLENLVGIIPGLCKATVGKNYNGGDYDVALYSVYDSKEALAAYRVHPEHKKVQQYVHSVICDRTAVDFECEEMDGSIDPYTF